MKAVRGWLPTLAVLAAPVSAAASLLLFAAGTRRGAMPDVHVRRWLFVWAPLLLPAVLVLASQVRSRDGWTLIGHVLLGVTASVVVRAPPRQAARTLVVVLLAMGALAAGSRWASARTWHALTPGAVRTVGLTMNGFVERLDGTGDVENASRAWSLTPGTREVVVALEAKADASEERHPADAIRLVVLVPTATGNWSRSVRFPLDAAWRRHTWTVRLPAGADVDYLQVRPVLPAGAGAVTRGLTATAVGGGGVHATPLATRTRLRLWFHHPNAFGHAAALAGAVVLTSGASSWLRLAALVLGYGCILLSGSRSAAVALAVPGGLVLLRCLLGTLGRSVPWRTRMGQAALLAAGLVIAAAAPLLVVLTRGEVPPNSRIAIWSVAASAIAAHPLQGPDVPFVQLWRDAPGTGADPVEHAHNLVLQGGIDGGIAGVVAVAWLLSGLLYVAWRQRGVEGAIFVSSVFVTQLFDATLFTPTILLLTILGVNLGADQATVTDMGARAK